CRCQSPSSAPWTTAQTSSYVPRTSTTAPARCSTMRSRWRRVWGGAAPRGPRGPAVFFQTGREISSPPAAMAAGVALLVLSQNPELTRSELDQLLTATALSASERALDAPLADPSDVLPRGRDGDGHDAKHGYGR